MNHEMFKKKFIEILTSKGVDVNWKTFHMHPIEENKKYNSMDDMFRLVVYAPINELEKGRIKFWIFTWMIKEKLLYFYKIVQ